MEDLCCGARILLEGSGQPRAARITRVIADLCHSHTTPLLAQVFINNKQVAFDRSKCGFPLLVKKVYKREGEFLKCPKEGCDYKLGGKEK